MGKSALVVAVAFLSSCTSSWSSPTRAPDGAAAVQVKCKNDRAECLSAAGTSCGSSGYHVLTEDAHSGGSMADLAPGPVAWWTMVVRCGRAPAGHREPGATAAAVVTSAPKSAYSPQAPSALACSSDYQCPVGQKCMKGSLSYEGTCAQPVNQHGAPVFTAPDPASLGVGKGQCSFDTQCPIGFRCEKGGSLYGNCIR
jgi:hypothetical protein